MLKIGIITGTTRPGRNNEAVARWVLATASKRTDAEFELVDIAAYNLPVLDEPMPASTGKYSKAHTNAWAAKIASFDAFIFVTPEYNHAIPGSLKNAIDYIYAEWNNKAAGIVSYGFSAAGARAAENLRLILGELQIADVRAQVLISLINDFKNFSVFEPAPYQADGLNAMLNQVISWGTALKMVREGTAVQA